MKSATLLRGALLLLCCLGVASQAAAGKKDKKAQAPTDDGGPRITILHKPGTPAEHLITINIRALPAHLAHGDQLLCAAPSGEDLVVDEASGLLSYTAVNCSLADVLDIFTVAVPVSGELPLLCTAIIEEQPPTDNESAATEESEPPLPVSYFSDGATVYPASALFEGEPAGDGFDPDGPYEVVAYYSCVINDN